MLRKDHQAFFFTVKDYLDLYQFAYREGIGLEDATTILINYIPEHLDKLGTYVRLLIVDFSIVFITIQSHLMIMKLGQVGANSHLVLWIFIYLSGSIQYVKLNNITSKLVFTYTGVPHCSVLVYSLYK